MKLVGLMLCSHDDWIVGLSARAALKWCDSVIIMDSSPTDDSVRISAEVLKEHPGRVSISSAAPDTKRAHMMETMLMEARVHGATHIVVLNPSEILTWNLALIKSSIFNVAPGYAVTLPVMFCWKNAKYYRDDPSIWSNASVPMAFADSPGVHWHGSPENGRVPIGLQLTNIHPVRIGLGGLVNLENVNWRRAVAKYYLSEMWEILKRDPWKGVKKPQKTHLLDEIGIKLSRVPEEWYKGYQGLFEQIVTDRRSYYETEVSRLIGQHGQETFSDIRLPGEIINLSEKVMPSIALNKERKVVVPLPPQIKEPPKVEPVKAEPPKPASPKDDKRSFPKHTVCWSGHFLDYSGYGKANREMLFRVSNTFNVVLNSIEVSTEPVLIDEKTKNRVLTYLGGKFPEGLPYLRFFGPREEARKGHKICFTMMETYGTHQDLVKLLNGYNEVWVPTMWNKTIFEESGVTAPVKTVPLGINQFIYRPGEKLPLPTATLLTTSRRGTKESPSGFLFVNTSNPSFRKGIDVVIRSFEDAFADNPDVALVLCVSYSSLLHCDPFMLIPGGWKACRSKIYVFEGKMDEYQMADMYRSCNAYVTASRGEGWNLPLMEASGCGLPVLAPNAFSHKEFLTEENCFLFTPDKLIPIPDAERISPWYKDQLFVDYDKKSIGHLTELLRLAANDPKLSAKKADCLRKEILEKYTWDVVAGRLTSRLLESSR